MRDRRIDVWTNKINIKIFYCLYRDSLAIYPLFPTFLNSIHSFVAHPFISFYSFNAYFPHPQRIVVNCVRWTKHMLYIFGCVYCWCRVYGDFLLDFVVINIIMRIYIDDESTLGIYVVSTNKPNEIEDKTKKIEKSYTMNALNRTHTKLIQSERKMKQKLNAFFCNSFQRQTLRFFYFKWIFWIHCDVKIPVSIYCIIPNA